MEQCVKISLVPTDVIQQMLTLTFMSLHILSPAKFPLLYSEWVYEYSLQQWDRTNTNVQNRVRAGRLHSPELAAEPVQILFSPTAHSDGTGGSETKCEKETLTLKLLNHITN